MPPHGRCTVLATNHGVCARALADEHAHRIVSAMIETEGPRARNRQGVAAFVLASISLLLSLMHAVWRACSSAVMTWICSRFSPDRRSRARPKWKPSLTCLPPGSVLLNAAYSNGLETGLSAKFRMPRTELDAFVATAKFTTAPAPDLRAVGAKQNVGGGNLWDPETAKTVSGLDEEQPIVDGTRRALLINLDAPEAVTVYLYARRD
jgi:hypothetical protein